MHLGFNQRHSKTLAKYALHTLMKHVQYDVICKLHAPPLKYQYIRAAARTIKALRNTLFYEHARTNRYGVGIPFFTVALYDVPDHHGYHFNHGNETCSGATVNVGIDYGHNSFVL